MSRLLWLDLEMTGLDEHVHHILEVAAVVTDMELRSLEEYDRVVYQPQSVIDLMDEWCVKTHGNSGLTARIPNGVPLSQIENDLLNLTQKHWNPKTRIVIAGNSIGNDRRFIDKYLPNLASRLHYRMVDVSSFKEIFRERYGLKFDKEGKHRAVQDIHESIRELSYYLSFVNIPGVTR